MFYPVKQWSDEWFNLRLGRITSSNLSDIMANLGKPFGEPAKRYARKLALERIMWKREEERFQSADMERGNELEPIARQLYEKEMMVDVDNGGFFSQWDIWDSPDGLVGEDGCIEIKSVIANTHWERIEKWSYDTTYHWQIHGHLWITGRKWCDFISYCPEFPESKQLYVFRVQRDDEVIKIMQSRVNDFLSLVTFYQNLIK